MFHSKQVNQRNVPGIDNAYLAMDTEEGVEVVWNEVMFSERKNFKLQEVKLLTVCLLCCFCEKDLQWRVVVKSAFFSLKLAETSVIFNEYVDCD